MVSVDNGATLRCGRGGGLRPAGFDEEPEGTAYASDGRDADLSTVQLGQLPADEEPETASTVDGVSAGGCLGEALEEDMFFIGFETAAGVFDFEAEMDDLSGAPVVAEGDVGGGVAHRDVFKSGGLDVGRSNGGADEECDFAFAGFVGGEFDSVSHEVLGLVSWN